MKAILKKNLSLKMMKTIILIKIILYMMKAI